LSILKASNSLIECFILSGLSKLSDIKDSNIGVLEYGGVRNINGVNQQINYTLTAPDISGEIQFAFKNGLTTNITLPWNVDAETTLNDLMAEILALAPTAYPDLTVNVYVTGSTITIIGDWSGGFPVLEAYPITGSWTAGAVSIGAEATRACLVDHMNEVMDDPDLHDFLYVPVYNLKSGVIDQSAVPPEELEETFINFYHLGTFVLDYRYDIGGLVPSVYVPVCPFPRAFYILKELIKYGEYNPEGDIFEDTDLFNLIIYTTHCLHRADVASLLENNLYSLQFKIGDLLPKVTVIEFLHSLRTTFGIQLFFNDVTRQCFVETFAGLLKSQKFVDWTSKVYSKPTVKPCEPTGYIFKFTNDENDDFITELVQPIENLVRLPDVERYTLPVFATITPKANDIVLTRREKNYYRAEFSSSGVLTGWVFHSVNFHELKVGDGKTTIETGSGSLTMHQGPYSVGSGESWLVPQAKQLLNPITPFDWAEKYNPFGLRYL
ncbi:MAG TPA: hypothetical protein PKD91_09130, partial [Bacteroidia bacterium]|nr:hypothetical protein [Bacteroidia bacterium]